MASSINILIGGEAGQGLVTVGEMLSKVLVRGGYSIVVTQDYQSRIRGGHNSLAIRVASDDLYAPTEATDVSFELDSGTANVGGVDLKVPYPEFGPARSANTASLGIAAAFLELDKELVAKVIAERFGRRGEGVVRENLDAMLRGYNWGIGQDKRLKSLSPPAKRQPRIMINGNEAIALGAISAGVRFCAFYPMTPSTTVSLSLIGHASTAGLVVEQAEDEISAINMAIGASFAGMPAMVATSGGGFALMVEGVSLAGMTETPVVIVVGQRPGPATGLPTRTEQADLSFVLHAGHGEFPRAIFAPGTVEECFYLTRRAFELAERYQGPVFILTDQFLADSFRAVEPFDIANLPKVKIGVEGGEIKFPYKRYALTEDGISPRLIPGLSENLVVAGSDEHTEDGHLTEDLAVRRLMVEKRLKKYKGLVRDTIAPVFTGEKDYDTLLVTWGSTYGAAVEAASFLTEKGRPSAVLHFPQVWPLVSEAFIHHLRAAGEVIAVEGNALGQFTGLIRRETSFEIKKGVHRYDGLPITPEYILNAIC